jgi:hypothetical protein
LNVNREQVLATTADAPKPERADAVSRFAEVLRVQTNAFQIGTPMRAEKCTGLVLPIPVDIS